jgi:signal peptide peptidase SppA
MGSKAITWIYDQQWAISAPALETIISIANRDRSDLGALLRGGGENVDTSALATKIGEPMRNGSRAEIRDGVAVIPIRGPIFPRANLFTNVSGATSLESLALDFNAALDIDEVRAIVLDVDSPGGQVNGTSEFSDMVYRARGRKPITAYVQGSGASGAYWIASAADEIVVADTALVGSVGVLTAYRDTSKADEAQGVQNVEIVSSVSPKKNLDPATDAGRAEVQRVVDDLAGVMVSAIARNRGVDDQHVLDNFGQGGVLVGRAAVEQGLADRVGTFEGVIQRFTDANTTQDRGLYMSESNTSGAEFSMTPEALRENHSETYDAVFAAGQVAGRNEGAEAERERIQAIEAIKAPGYEDVIAELKFKPEATRESVADAILTKQNERREQAGAAYQQDGEAVGAATENVQQDAGDDDQADVDAAVGHMVSGANAKR